MRNYIKWISISAMLFTLSCKTTRKAVYRNDDKKIEVVFVQVNDVYEIAPIAGGKEGGMARVATIKKQYKNINPNTFLVMSGDFVSPSVYNSLQYQGKRIRGAQMVESMNAAGMDIVCFGNHEFDITEKELQDRINESGFLWVSSNAFHKVKDSVMPFVRTNVANAKPFPEKYIMTVRDKDGTTAKIGFFGITIPSNQAEHVTYKDPFATAKQMYNELKDSVDAVVAITHQAVADDERMATELPGLALILGGHEHDMEFRHTGNVYITKAHANARSAYIDKILIDKAKRSFKVTTELKYLNEKVVLDSNTNVVVEKWKKIASDNYTTIGFDPKEIVLASGQPLDGRETEIRAGSTNFTRLVTEAMAYACPQADVVIFNAGSIRLDDILIPPVSQYDIIRSMPFGGGITEVDMKGTMLLEVLQTGMKNAKNGGYLQSLPVEYNKGKGYFTINNLPVDTAKTYRVAVTDFLISGKETNLAFLNTKSAGISKVYSAEPATDSLKSDIRLAIIKYLKSKK